MLWKEAMEISDMEYQTAAHRLQPGDIILCHFRGPAQLDGETMVRMMTRLYKHIQAQGFTVADITSTCSYRGSTCSYRGGAGRPTAGSEDVLAR